MSVAEYPVCLKETTLLLVAMSKRGIYYIKTKCCLSVCLSVGTFWHARSSAVSPRNDVRLARNEAPVLEEQAVHFKMVLIHVVRHLRRFECQGVDDSCRNFTYIPAKPQSRHDR